MVAKRDVVVVGSGPNGLAAAVTLARAGLGVTVLEAQPTVGGGARTLDLGLADGVVHDVCSAVHPMAWASPFFRGFDLRARGVELLTPEVSFAQPLPDGRAGIAYHDLDRTVVGLEDDGPAWREVVGRLAEHADHVVRLAMGDKRSIPPGLLPGGVPTAARFGWQVLEQGTTWGRRFRGDVAPALLTGVAAHAISPLPSLAGAGTALLLAALGHAGAGWPVPRGGSGAIVAALVADLEAHGGEIRTGHRVAHAGDLPPAHAYLFDTTPRTVVDVLGDRLPARHRAALRRFRYGNAAAKVDFVLSGPVPWAVPEVGRAGTVHLGGTRDEMIAAEADVHAGRHAERPMTLLSDPTVVDDSRRVGGLRPLWTYAHVPAGSDVDVTEAVTAHVERYAPGFRDVVVASRCVPAAHMSTHNENYVDGDICAGATTMWQMFARPTPTRDPYATGRDGVYLCSASTPPGPGVHGLSGWFAARRVLREVFCTTQRPSLAPAAGADLWPDI
ncbi:phytoene desaturase family protein [Cellulomonas fimi]|uniref:Pyridine nucleotide-disulfide oxidoreductase domain-containing protein 2 n=1 Tax=Cellulomonas fimi (strain ATCC 484 / DSM 20113 / JCM 1341 / CCUG 24087 / LMG 16345 / NBRC 15513 / NCIMB 8980 / NCTC 7547 / NRS-133) TaxID=590998 RepID=F4H6W8_CELFA|nr:NAD(P)/FAD-dependent oxidoreductase [Cellulomonas fimi]AEE44477.1 FAD dependent oxidoreductase [Cellulomonas fimi ATCC 484]NNH06624.1 NAD(P)/FAD-dependent oxidoreductase [Cellulomonas fimi]VEH26438.1 Protoporphyrinogen oxidase [Cellulomonas fimi]